MASRATAPSPRPRCAARPARPLRRRREGGALTRAAGFPLSFCFPRSQYFGVLAGSWQMVCSQMLYSNVHTTVDPATGEICLSFDVTLIMDGRGAVPITEASTFQGQNCFKLTLNAEHKLVKFVGTWDSTDPKVSASSPSRAGGGSACSGPAGGTDARPTHPNQMMAAFGAVLAAKEA